MRLPSYLLMLAVSALGTQGCALLAVPVMGSAMSVGAEGLAKAGMAKTMGGSTYRTFSAPLTEVYDAARTTLKRLDWSLSEDEIEAERVRVRAVAIDRNVKIDLQPITPAMTQMKVTVGKEPFGKDEMTASELMAQTEEMLSRSPSALSKSLR